MSLISSGAPVGASVSPSSILAANGWVLKYTRITDGGTIANSTTPTVLDNAFSFQPADLTVGSIIHMEAMGIYSTDGTAQTPTTEVLFGSNSNNKNLTFGTTQTNQTWSQEGNWLIRVAGAGGQVYRIPALAAWNSGANILYNGGSAPWTQAAIDMSVAVNCSVKFTWSALAAGATTTLKYFAIWIGQAQFTA